MSFQLESVGTKQNFHFLSDVQVETIIPGRIWVPPSIRLKIVHLLMVLASIRKISGKKKLKKITVKTAAPVPFEKINTVGLIYYLEEEEGIKKLVKIQQHPFFKNKAVDLICWLKTTKKKPHPVVEGITFIDRSDFDTNFLPGSKKVRYFCEKDFDLLLDLTSNYHFPTHAMTVMSNAKLKTGADHKFNWHIQVKIKLPDSKKNNTSYLLEQILGYLEKLFP